MRQPRPYSVQASVWNGVAVIFQGVLDLFCPTCPILLSHTLSPNCESGMTHREERKNSTAQLKRAGQRLRISRTRTNTNSTHVECCADREKQKQKTKDQWILRLWAYHAGVVASLICTTMTFQDVDLGALGCIQTRLDQARKDQRLFATNSFLIQTKIHFKIWRVLVSS